MRKVPILLFALAASACAVAVPRIDPAAVVRLQKADALVEAGCYRCLEEAFEVFGALASGPQPPADVQSRMFTTALLLALREKELGLEAKPWLDRATALGAGPEAATYVEIASSIPWENAGVPEFESARRPAPGTLASWKAFLERSESNTVLDRYLSLSLGCGVERWSLTGLPDRLTTNTYDDEPAIIRYRLGACASALRTHLETLLDADSRFAEAAFFLGRFASTDYTPDRLSRAHPYLTRAYEAFPEAPAVATILANVERGRYEMQRALALYDRALTLRPSHRDALLGRVITLTTLGRSQDAIDSATRLIDLGTWHIGDAYYWRAWNQYQLQKLAEAAVDVAQAKKLLINGEVLTLSGIVAYEQKRRNDARREFDDARDINPGNCTASWYLGFIKIEETAWPAAAEMFAYASSCYRDAAREFQADAAALSPELSPEARQYLGSDYDRRIADSLRQQARGAFNAAQALIRIGERARAVEHARIAAQHDDMRERAESLLRSLEQN